MTFRKDPVPSAEPNSSEKPVSTRPRNHHAPDPPKSSTGMLVDNGEIHMKEMGGANKQQSSHHHELVVAYSPTPSSLSSGYSSLRVSDNSLTANHCHQCAQYLLPTNSQTNQNGNCGNSLCGYCSPTLCPYLHYPPFSCHCQIHTSSLIVGKKGTVCGEHRRVEVPSTIREESENSHLSQRSKTSVDKVCFA